MPSTRLLAPSCLDDLVLFRMTRLLAVAGAPVIRLCEGKHNITRREWRLIAALAHFGVMQSSTLADRIHLDRGRTSKAVSDLAAKNLILRKPRAGDRRKVDIALTAAGQAIHDALFPEVVRINQALLSVLSAAEVLEFDRLLGLLQVHADHDRSVDGLPKANRQRTGQAR